MYTHFVPPCCTQSLTCSHMFPSAVVSNCFNWRCVPISFQQIAADDNAQVTTDIEPVIIQIAWQSCRVLLSYRIKYACYNECLHLQSLGGSSFTLPRDSLAVSLTPLFCSSCFTHYVDLRRPFGCVMATIHQHRQQTQLRDGKLRKSVCTIAAWLAHAAADSGKWQTAARAFERMGMPVRMILHHITTLKICKISIS